MDERIKAQADNIVLATHDNGPAVDRQPQVPAAVDQLIDIGKRLHEEVQMLEDRIAAYLSVPDESALLDSVEKRPAVPAAQPLLALCDNLDNLVHRLGDVRSRFEG